MTFKSGILKSAGTSVTAGFVFVLVKTSKNHCCSCRWLRGWRSIDNASEEEGGGADRSQRRTEGGLQGGGRWWSWFWWGRRSGGRWRGQPASRGSWFEQWRGGQTDAYGVDEHPIRVKALQLCDTQMWGERFRTVCRETMTSSLLCLCFVRPYAVSVHLLLAGNNTMHQTHKGSVASAFCTGSKVSIFAWNTNVGDTGMKILVVLCESWLLLHGFQRSSRLISHRTFSSFYRTVGRNSPTLEISRDTCVFTLGRSRSAVGTATRLSLTLRPVKPTRKPTGELHRFGLPAHLSSIALMS